MSCATLPGQFFGEEYSPYRRTVCNWQPQKCRKTSAKCQTYSKSLLTSMPLVTCTCSHFQTWFASFRSIELAVVVFLQPAATNPRRYCAAMSVVISIITHRFGGCCRHNGGRIQRESSELLSRQQEDILVAARHQSKIFGKRRTANPSPPIHLQANQGAWRCRITRTRCELRLHRNRKEESLFHRD